MPLPVQEMLKTQDQSLGWEDSLEKELTAAPVFLPGKSHGHMSLKVYSPWGCKEMDTTEHTKQLFSS